MYLLLSVMNKILVFLSKKKKKNQLQANCVIFTSNKDIKIERERKI